MATGQAGAEIAVDQSPTLNCNHEAPILAGPKARGGFFDRSYQKPLPGEKSAAYWDRMNAYEEAHGITPEMLSGGISWAGPTHTLRGEGHDASEDGTGRGVPLAFAAFKGGQGSKAGGIGYDEHVAPTLSAADSGTNRTPALMQGMAVRRLTPRECERLQGMPDDWTLVPNGKGQMADGPRYKMCGNGFARPVVEWIFGRIDGVRNG